MHAEARQIISWLRDLQSWTSSQVELRNLMHQPCTPGRRAATTATLELRPRSRSPRACLARCRSQPQTGGFINWSSLLFVPYNKHPIWLPDSLELATAHQKVRLCECGLCGCLRCPGLGRVGMQGLLGLWNLEHTGHAVEALAKGTRREGRVCQRLMGFGPAVRCCL